jgi:hypothetical protein
MTKTMESYWKFLKPYERKNIDCQCFGIKPNEYLNFLPTLWHAMILVDQYLGLP